MLVHDQTGAFKGRVRVAGFAVSVDGFGAGPDQSLEDPLGKRGKELHRWFFASRTFRSMVGQEGGTDDRFASAGMEGFGAFILGRNMFGPIRGEWPDEEWKGWWGDNPPTTRRPSSSPTTPARPSRWRAARRSTSSPTASSRRSPTPRPRRAIWT